MAEGGNQTTVAVGCGVSEGKGVEVTEIASAGAQDAGNNPIKKIKNMVRMK